MLSMLYLELGVDVFMVDLLTNFICTRKKLFVLPGRGEGGRGREYQRPDIK